MPGPSDLPQPIPYQGSKRQIAAEIISHFPQRMHRLVEPFAGSAAISIAIAARHRAKHFWLNDAHAPLIDLWRKIIDFPVELADAYEELWHTQFGKEREFFDEVRARFNKSHDPADFLYLLAGASRRLSVITQMASSITRLTTGERGAPLRDAPPH